MPAEGRGVLGASEGTEERGLAMGLATPQRIRTFQRKLYDKAKREPEFRFYLVYDKVWRTDMLEHAYRLCRSNGGAAGVDGLTFRDIESTEGGLESWLSILAAELREERYRPQAVRRVVIAKADGGERSLGGSRRYGTGWRRRPPSWCWNRSTRLISSRTRTGTVPSVGHWMR